MVVAAEPFQRDDPDRPGADTSLAGETRDGCVARQVAEPLEVDAADDPGERRGAVLRQPVPAQVERRQLGQCLAGCHR